MTKKKISFSSKPNIKSTEYDLDKWVNQAESTASTPLPSSLNEESSELMKKMTLRVPEDLHKNFKVLCVNRGITVTDAIIALMESELEKY